MQKQLNRGTTFSTNGAGAIGHLYAKKKKRWILTYMSHFELRKQRHHFANQCPYSPTMVFPVVMYRGESCTIKKAECQRIDAFKLWYWRTLESPLDSKEIKPVNPKGNQSWTFIGRTDAKAEASIFWPLDVKRQLNGKDPDAGKEWGQEEKGVTEGEMVEWHQRVNGHEFEETPRDGKRQGSLTCSNSHVTKSWTWLGNWKTTTKW